MDARAWLLWGLAASLVPLLGRNPWPLLATLLAVLGVRAAWASGRPGAASWGTLLRLAAFFAAFGVLFNVLTVPVGDRVLVRVPDGVPIVGDVLTLNALAYGVLSGLALLTLVTVGTTLGAVLDWAETLRLLPGRLAGIATAGSVAFAFVPQTVTAFREIREAQAARGYRVGGARGLVPILVPLMAGGMERALTLAEALESRAFGSAPGGVAAPPAWRRPAIALGLAAGVTGGYLLAVGDVAVAIACLGGGGLLLGVGSRERRGERIGRTRYREPRWGRGDTLVVVASVGVMVAVAVSIGREPRGLRYEPYPALDPPRVDLLLLVALAGLLAPVFVGQGAPPAVQPLGARAPV